MGMDSGTGKSVTIRRYCVAVRATGCGTNVKSLAISLQTALRSSIILSMARGGCTTALFFLLTATSMAQPQNTATPAPQAANGFVGSDACKTCHADVWFNFYKN